VEKQQAEKKVNKYKIGAPKALESSFAAKQDEKTRKIEVTNRLMSTLKAPPTNV